ncbi:hypothetical protein BDW72DRAFT_79239 [Aspergillus terricola var. indicus]
MPCPPFHQPSTSASLFASSPNWHLLDCDRASTAILPRLYLGLGLCLCPPFSTVITLLTIFFP